MKIKEHQGTSKFDLDHLLDHCPWIRLGGNRKTKLNDYRCVYEYRCVWACLFYFCLAIVVSGKWMPNVALATMMISSTLRLSNNCFIRLSVILIIDYPSVCVSPAPAPATAAAPCPGLAFASASVITNALAPASACHCLCLCLCSCPCPSLCRCLCRREQKERVKRKRSEGQRR